MKRVAFIGLGAMGSRMARRLLDAHYELIVWNRDPAKATALIEHGAIQAASPATAARGADVVITMVTDALALRDVTEGADGALAAVSSHTTFIQMSTVGREGTARLIEQMPNGTGLIDAPVLGSLGEAESGTLKVFASGEPALIQGWTPLLETLGTVLNVGPLGAGTAAKLVANSTLFGALGVLGEALALARAMGLPDERAFDVLAVTPMAAQAERRRAAIESGHYPPRFALSLALKDADLVLEAAAATQADLRLAAAARTWLAEAAAEGLGDRDYSAALMRILEQTEQHER